MAQLCDSCGKSVHRRRYLTQAKKFVGMDCGCFRELQATSAITAFSDLTLEHIHDEAGKPVRVTSLRQLREAETRYNFRHHAANMDPSKMNDAPQHGTRHVGDFYKRKFGR